MGRRTDRIQEEGRRKGGEEKARIRTRKRTRRGTRKWKKDEKIEMRKCKIILSKSLANGSEEMEQNA
jgi:hypothetical protein